MHDVASGTVLYLIKYFFASIFLLLIVPRVIFVYNKGGGWHALAAGYIKTVFLVVVTGYFTVAVKLFEFVTVLGVMLFLAVSKYNRGRIARGDVSRDLKDDVNLLVINHLERIETIQGKLLLWWERRINRFKLLFVSRLSRRGFGLTVFLLTVVFGVGAWLFLADSVMRVAPAGQEGYLSLLRAKHIGGRLLFRDGVLPQGFYIFLSVLQKFTQADYLYVVNFTAALNAITIGLGLYLFTSGTVGGPHGGVLAAVGFCWLSGFSPQIARFQTVPSAEQMAVALLFFLLYFAHEYQKKGEKRELLTVCLGLSAIGMIAPPVLVPAAAGVILLLLASLLRWRKGALTRGARLIGAWLTGAASGLIPLAGGLLLREELTVRTLWEAWGVWGNTGGDKLLPPLTVFDSVLLVCLGLVLLHGLLGWKEQDRFVAGLWVFFMGAAAFAGAYFTPALGEWAGLYGGRLLWGLLWPVIAAGGLHGVLTLFSALLRRPVNWTALLLTAAAMAAVPFVFPLRPVREKPWIPEHLTRQYLSISQEVRPTRWMMVCAEEGAPLVYGNGFYMAPGEFAGRYSPRSPRLIDGSGLLSKHLSANDIFIFYEKNAPGDQQIGAWLDIYRRGHDNISLYHKEEGLEVWRIHQAPDREEAMESMWQE